MRAEFLAALGASPDDVEAELERALRVARSQGAPALALRIVTSALRFQRQRSDEPGTDRARDALRVLLAEMPGSDETPDVLEARSLLL